MEVWHSAGSNRQAHQATIFQVALAWLLRRSSVMPRIPDTFSLAHLEENVAAWKLKLTSEVWKTIDGLARHS